ncbi:hypothetical protein CEUSTIGMA_g13292.t1 [Chlamydomonas eustigma]|uniref:Uncharacterized protein n=1 Tax=Chlamydomonas eustigma TaxID=1157962 RepID=A0A250XS59_9CHLO|nr:hypothetical protein CEUSTIGMA_g13292.t1 [Chlamydomonas eustigma]|eukprot:GAX85876.1 hypothetical protein CEUSTIGMA_g13292.t1 [Chlamydomonas eustigma]
MEPVILLAGASSVGKRALVNSLLTGQLRSPLSARESFWSINTKYYTVRVRLKEHDIRDVAAVQPEALILVIDCHRPASFEEVRTWAERFGMLESAEIKLLIANKADLLLKHASAREPERSAWLNKAMEWCASTGLEYIETCATDPSVDAALVLDGDPQGTSRVAQALHAHAWPGMELKARGNHRVALSGQSADAENVQQQADISPSSVNTYHGEPGRCGSWEGGQEQEGPDEAHTDCMEQSRSDGAAGMESCRTSRQVVPEPAEGSASGPASESAPENAVLDELDKMDQFERMMEEIQSAKQRFERLPDSDRRSQAAAMALSLASMLGLEESGDELEEGEEEEDGVEC